MISGVLAAEGEEQQVGHLELVVRPELGVNVRFAHDRELAALHRPVERLGDDPARPPAAAAVAETRPRAGCRTTAAYDADQVLLARGQPVERAPAVAVRSAAR
jgi:hypothetical protein